MSITMEGENKGVVLGSKIDIPYRFEGLYWFRIEFDGRIITRIPLEVRYARMVTGPTTPS